MPDSQEKIKEFWEEKTEEIATKIDKTPMEKFFVLFLIIITASAVVLGYLQLRQNIKVPLYSSILSEERAKIKQQYQVDNNVNTVEQAELTRLQNQDSDLDGLSDYSEIYLYKTSAYLEDSDSDGIWDKQEILAGSDPNCPEGQVCETSISQTESSQPAVTEFIASDIDQEVANGLDLGDMEDLLQLESQLLSGELDLADIGIDDPDLQAILEQVRESNIPELDQLSDEEKDQVKQSLENLTPEEIRQELQARGIDRAILDQVSDEQMMEIFMQTLNLY